MLYGSIMKFTLSDGIMLSGVDGDPEGWSDIGCEEIYFYVKRQGGKCAPVPRKITLDELLQLAKVELADPE